MKNLVTKIKNRRQAAKTFKAISYMTDRQLRDIGFEPHMVRCGVREFPWGKNAS